MTDQFSTNDTKEHEQVLWGNFESSSALSHTVQCIAILTMIQGAGQEVWGGAAGEQRAGSEDVGYWWNKLVLGMIVFFLFAPTVGSHISTLLALTLQHPGVTKDAIQYWRQGGLGAFWSA